MLDSAHLPSPHVGDRATAVTSRVRRANSRKPTADYFSMLNVIVPLAGSGHRFLCEGYIRPKPFIKAFGKELLLWLLGNLSFQPSDMLVLVFNCKPEVGMSATTFLNVVEDHFVSVPKNLRPCVRYVCLDEPTVGAAETALRGIECLSAERLILPSVLLDGDTFYTVDILTLLREKMKCLDKLNRANMGGGAVVIFEDDRPDDAPYSYVKIGPLSDEIMLIKEKNKEGMSGFACSGCYCFHHTHTLMVEISGALERHNQSANSTIVQKELYTSSIISKMLEKGGLFQAIKLKTSDFSVLGTPSQLRSFISSQQENGQHKKRFCFDLDHTLVTSPTVPGDYTTCKPIPRVISYLQKLHTDGHYIIIHTARRMRTHDGNIGRVIADIGAITIQQLNDYVIPYDELIFGKPFADFYVDDKAIIPFVDELHKETGIL